MRVRYIRGRREGETVELTSRAAASVIENHLAVPVPPVAETQVKPRQETAVSKAKPKPKPRRLRRKK